MEHEIINLRFDAMSLTVCWNTVLSQIEKSDQSFLMQDSLSGFSVLLIQYVRSTDVPMNISVDQAPNGMGWDDKIVPWDYLACPIPSHGICNTAEKFN
jgi:hypothetical protein